MTAKLSHPRVLVLAIAGLLLGLVASTLLMASPVHADHAPVHGTILGRAPFADPVDLKIRATVGGRKRTIQVRESAETVVQHIVVQPGGFTGWHTHPGPAVALVVEGSLTLYQGKDPRCRGFEYGPSEAFIDPGDFIQADLSDERSTARLVKRLGDRYQVDGLVNNAGNVHPGSLEEATAHDLRDTLEVHVRAAIQVTQALIPGMRERGWGRIVNMASVVPLGSVRRTTYGAAKGALIAAMYDD